MHTRWTERIVEEFYEQVCSVRKQKEKQKKKKKLLCEGGSELMVSALDYGVQALVEIILMVTGHLATRKFRHHSAHVLRAGNAWYG